MKIHFGKLLLLCLTAAFCVLMVRACVYIEQGKKANSITGQQEQTHIQVSVDGKRQQMSLEEYLLGVVAAEMPASFEQEALRAQAVASRTYTLYQSQHGGCSRTGADVCTDSSCCQAFCDDRERSENWGSRAKENEARIQQAIQSTAGQVVCCQGEPIEALFHAASGGYTEDSQHVFSAARSYLVSVASTHEVGSSAEERETALSTKEFVKTVNSAYPQADLSRSRLQEQIKVLSRYGSGRVDRVQVGEISLTGREFRSLFSLASTNFSLAFGEDTVSIRTEGYGHGVGMSQTGANGMALDGADYRQILQHYYTGCTVEQYAV